jgi:glyoxylase-like metal-dependent hydrolase (beta-lactamase superfamily II)
LPSVKAFAHVRPLEPPALNADVSRVRPASDVDRVTSNIAIWHAYDPSARAELYSTCRVRPGGSDLIDPTPLQNEVLEELIGSQPVAGIIVTNSNHHRAAAQFASQFSVPIFAHPDTFPNPPSQLRKVADGEEISDGLRVIGIDGAAPGEVVLYYAPNGGTLIVGDALINFEPYGFASLPAKYCLNQKQMRGSLRKLLDYDAERILFAHGTPILSRASERLQALLDSSS